MNPIAASDPFFRIRSRYRRLSFVFASAAIVYVSSSWKTRAPGGLVSVSRWSA